MSIRYTERLAQAGIELPVGSRGDSYDNALAEMINGLYKAELILRELPGNQGCAVSWQFWNGLLGITINACLIYRVYSSSSG